MKTVIRGSLSEQGIRDIQRQLEEYKKTFNNRTQLFIERLAMEGVNIARAKITSLDAIFTGELLQSIRREPREITTSSAKFAIITDSEHACFVEFGTGQRGMDTPYPYPLPNGVSWNYATGSTIKKNPITGHYYWFYPGQDGKWHYTEGMPARPFMYETSLELSRIIDRVSKEVFG